MDSDALARLRPIYRALDPYRQLRLSELEALHAERPAHGSPHP